VVGARALDGLVSWHCCSTAVAELHQVCCRRLRLCIAALSNVCGKVAVVWQQMNSGRRRQL
jgi:hypothetical protein